MAEEEAGPVLPLLVAEDWAVEAPEAPEVARGSMVALMLPPFPPLASALAMASPPVMRTGPVIVVVPLVVSEAAPPPTATRTGMIPPLPPAPAVSREVGRA